MFFCAVCLDGSLPGYHFHRGYGSGSNSWLIQLEVCETPELFELGAPMREHNGFSFVTDYDHPFHFSVLADKVL